MSVDYPLSEHKTLLVHSREINVTIICNSKHFDLYKITGPHYELLLFALHMPSLLHRGREDQTSISINVVSEIRHWEKKYPFVPSILVGDFNQNPFDDGMMNANGFNAIMCPSMAKTRKNRTYDSIKYPFYYNPMWHYSGNRNNPTLGTYYYDDNRIRSIYWHTFDQVLLSQGLIDHFDHDSLKIISKVGHHNLTKSNGKPNKNEYSDHLPIKFRLNMEAH